MMIKRCVSGLLDMCLISAISVFTSVELMNEYKDIVFVITFIVLILSKDLVFNLNQSVFKALFGLQVVNNNGGRVSFYQVVFRNITLLFYPLEMIFLLIFKKRLGDYILKTNVIPR